MSRREKQLPVSRLSAVEVRGCDGEVLGRIDDAVIDPVSGRLAYLVMTVIDSNFRKLKVPYAAFSVGTDQRYLVLDIDRETMRLAHDFDKRSTGSEALQRFPWLVVSDSSD